jgi:hypothetical protein
VGVILVRCDGCRSWFWWLRCLKSESARWYKKFSRNSSPPRWTFLDTSTSWSRLKLHKKHVVE